MIDSDSLFGLEPKKLKRLMALGFEDLDTSEVKDSLPRSASHPFVETLGDWIGPYRLLSIVGEGGYGVVYLAEQRRPVKRSVALKIIKAGMDSKQVIARFEAERQALALLNHPHIAHVFDGGTTKTGRPYFVMEYVQGQPITEYCDQHKLRIEERLGVFQQVCEAVQHAHQKGVIHRDIKPSNILVMEEQEKAIPKIIDFGIAKAIHQPLTEQTLCTEQGQFVGTPEYMSPEQAEIAVKDIDTRTDVYALGIVLYELLTGTLPFALEEFKQGDIKEIQRIIRETNPLRPSTRLFRLGDKAKEVAERRQTEAATLIRRLRKELEWIPMKAMRKDRTRRYQAASELADDIRNYLLGWPLIAGPESATYRFTKFIGKHRVPVTAAAAVVFSLMVGLVISTVMHRRAQRAFSDLTRLEAKVEVETVLATAERLRAAGHYEDALNFLETTNQSHASNLKSQLLKAQLLFEVGRWTAAKTLLLDLTNEDPTISGSAHYLLARITLGEEPDVSAEHRRLAESILPKTAEAYSLRAMTAQTPEEVLRWLSQAIELDPTHQPSHEARALAYYGLGEFQKMAQDIPALIALRPGDYLGYALRAIVHRESEQFDQALADHNRAIDLCTNQKELPTLYSQRRETHMRAGNYSAALSDAKNCATMEPNKLVHAFHIFTTLLAQRDFVAAKNQYTHITRQSAGWHRDFNWWTKNYVIGVLSAGKILELSADVRFKAPFSAMYETVQSYRMLEKTATQILPWGYWYPCWSPNGLQIAYTRSFAHTWRPQMITTAVPSIQSATGIEIMDLVSRKRRLLTQFGSYGSVPAWSPDGQNIVFTHNIFPIGTGEIWIIPASGGKRRKLANGYTPCWSADSQHVYYRVWPEGTIYSIAVDASNPAPKRIMDCPGTFPGWFAVSPDNKYLAYENASKIHIVEFPSGKLVFQWPTPWPLYAWHPIWCPDSRHLIVGEETWYGQSSFWVLDREQRQAGHVLDRPVTHAVVSPTGSQVLLNLRDGIWLGNIDPNRPITESFGPALSREEFLSKKISQLDRYVEAEPTNAENYLWRAIMYISLADYGKAREDLKSCTDLVQRPDDPAIFLMRWWAWRHAQCDLRAGGELLGLRAVTLIERFLLDPRKPSWHYNSFRQLMKIYAAEKKKTEIARCLSRETAVLARISTGSRKGRSSVLNHMHASGSTHYDRVADSYTIIGRGTDLWGMYDQFHFVYKKLSGDGSITARIDNIHHTHQWTKAGIMIRSDLEPSSVNAAIVITPSRRIAFQYRPDAWTESLSLSTDNKAISLPHRIRLTRQGNRFTAQHSNDGVRWETVRDSKTSTAASVEISMLSDVYVGLAVTSRAGPFISTEAKISNVTFTGAVTPDGPFRISKDIGFLTSEIPEVEEQ